MITVVGTGTGAPVPEDVLAGAALVVGGRRHLDAVRLPGGAERVVLGPLAPALDTIAGYVGKELPVVVLASGDPGFFGIVRALAERFGSGLLDVRPGVSSVAAAFARIGLPWDDAVVVSAHGRELRTAVNVCRARPKVAVLTGPGAGPAELGAAVPPDRVLVVARALGDPERERVERVTPAEAAARDWGTAVSVVLCLDEARALGAVRTVAGVPGAPARWALDEGEFGHRDSMITKFEVRALALARLGPRLGDLVWDVGAGSGSVAVECARLGAAVVAVEKTPDGVARIRANADAHGVDVDVVHGSAPQALAALPDDPDAVFVGGGGRELPAIVTACARRARRTVVVAMAALDRVPAAREALSAAGFGCEGVLLQASRLAPLPGDVTRLAATNPVFLLWGVRTPASSEGVVQ
ncbi:MULTISPECIES: bifunctional cobalt-precorrin-7 (C(5))-methyltransferase/cobalt-precorrin-6B (C(15))-methyltransferase [Streptomyces]|uniref:bifunctional cobalt-precorrin-7 (C(5))-methyltransferase/cobalt-precorrin-6B (C(15))-methyltransferase n=1 Tax=Streptomyces TaxID=1883 RepID=UPI00073DC8BE|nr:bifunctional cobalt-precorrin-7 (C(5))-methyltransferase/cobalt-precorrin-6B (C(15))-methyltransferase [Streptomyces sp. EAS-AB2608]BCM66012.1 putative precorrin-6Y C5,15-methyltransferase [Streptomyces sp. EAS-AB2608]CUW27607.1 Precorrin-6Y C(5,15)-methyltransferase [decarboxylating] [Streptomyces reticuli]